MTEADGQQCSVSPLRPSPHSLGREPEMTPVGRREVAGMRIADTMRHLLHTHALQQGLTCALHATFALILAQRATIGLAKLLAQTRRAHAGKPRQFRQGMLTLRRHLQPLTHRLEMPTRTAGCLRVPRRQPLVSPFLSSIGVRGSAVSAPVTSDPILGHLTGMTLPRMPAAQGTSQQLQAQPLPFQQTTCLTSVLCTVEALRQTFRQLLTKA